MTIYAAQIYRGSIVFFFNQSDMAYALAYKLFTRPDYDYVKYELTNGKLKKMRQIYLCREFRLSKEELKIIDGDKYTYHQR